MRRFILLLVLSFLLISCNDSSSIPTLTSDSGIVCLVSSCNVNICGYKYRVWVQITTKSGELKKYELFTDKLYTVGDTIKIK